MRVRVLLEQQVHSSTPDRRYLPSGEEVDLPSDWAKELLNRGEAEPVAQKSAARAEKRPSRTRTEKRG